MGIRWKSRGNLRSESPSAFLCACIHVIRRRHFLCICAPDFTALADALPRGARAQTPPPHGGRTAPATRFTPAALCLHLVASPSGSAGLPAAARRGPALCVPLSAGSSGLALRLFS